MTEEPAFVLANEDSPMFGGGPFQVTAPSIHNVPRIMDAFRKGGGIPYSEAGEDLVEGTERFFRPGYLNFLVKDWLGAVPGLVARLEKGAQVAAIRCGCCQSTVATAEAFPRSMVLRID